MKAITVPDLSELVFLYAQFGDEKFYAKDGVVTFPNSLAGEQVNLVYEAKPVSIDATVYPQGVKLSTKVGK